jgi:hypothetical protein
MTDSTYTHVAVLVDCSGSMAEHSDPPRLKCDDATAGVHAFVEEQRKQPGRVTFSLTEFSTVRKDVAVFTSGLDLLPSAEYETDGWVCHPHGGTALLDSIVSVITRTGTALKALPEAERPGKVVMLIWTDGAENSSVKFSRLNGGPQKVAQIIQHQRDTYDWQFVYLGIGEEAYLSGSDYGFSATENVFVVAAATADSYNATNEAVSTYRSSGPGGQSLGESYTPEVRTRLAKGQ